MVVRCDAEVETLKKSRVNDALPGEVLPSFIVPENSKCKTTHKYTYTYTHAYPKEVLSLSQFVFNLLVVGGFIFSHVFF